MFTALKLIGAAYLIYLGVQTVRHRGDLHTELSVTTPGADRRLFRQGVFVGATNPKVLVFFSAFLPQFVDPAAGSVTAQMLVLGLLFGLIASLLDCGWGLAAGTARTWFATSPRRLSWLGGVGGVTLVGVGAALAVTGRRD